MPLFGFVALDQQPESRADNFARGGIVPRCDLLADIPDQRLSEGDVKGVLRGHERKPTNTAVGCHPMDA